MLHHRWQHHHGTKEESQLPMNLTALFEQRREHPLTNGEPCMRWKGKKRRNGVEKQR
jgi:hypothetical protein